MIYVLLDVKKRARKRKYKAGRCPRPVLSWAERCRRSAALFCEFTYSLAAYKVAGGPGISVASSC